MQERTEEPDGDIFRQFIAGKTVEDLRKRQLKLYKEAIANPRTHSIMQRKIGRNKVCPCGSGLKFKKCCIVKVNKGEERISRTA